MVKDLIADAVESALPKGWMPQKDSDFLVNPTGNFVVGGPDGDCGLTGRKIIVDTYGGYAPHGGGAFSGKDPTKVDRSAAYAARYLAKNVVAAGLAERCTIQVAYAIGVADPMSLLVDTHKTGKVDEAKLEKVLAEMFPLRPTNIRRTLKLNRPIYRRTAAYGHFGRAPEKDGGFSWERTDLAATCASSSIDRILVVAFSAENRRPLFRKMLWVEFCKRPHQGCGRYAFRTQRSTGRRRTRLFRAPQGQEAAPAASGLVRDAAAAACARSDKAAARAICEHCSTAPTRSAWKSASAAASISWPKPSAIRALALSAPSRS